MQATITYDLTEQAQRAAMKATGQSIARFQTMIIEVPAEDLDLFPIDSKGNIKLALDGFHPPQAWARALHAVGWAAVGFNGSGLEATVIDPPLIEDYRRGAAIVAEQDAAQAALEHENGLHNFEVTEVAYQAFLQDPGARIKSGEANPSSLVGQDNLRSPADWYPANHEPLMAEIKRRDELDAAARRAEAKAKAEAEKTKEQAKLDYIDAWVWANASPDIQAQYKAGLMERQEILTMIADQMFAIAGLPVAWQVELCNSDSCPCGVTDVNAIPAAVYAKWAPLAKGLPEGTQVEFEKARDCERDPDGYADGDGASEPYYTALVKLPVGPLTMKRRIKIAG